MTFNTRASIVLAAVLIGSAPSAYAQPPRDLYTQALARDRSVRDARHPATLRQIRLAVAAYERVVRRYPASGYADNALWQGGELSRLAWERFGDDADRRTCVRLLKQLQAGYSSSSLLSGVEQALARLEAVKAVPTSGSVASSTPSPSLPPPAPAPATALRSTSSASRSAASAEMFPNRLRPAS